MEMTKQTNNNKFLDFILESTQQQHNNEQQEWGRRDRVFGGQREWG